MAGRASHAGFLAAARHDLSHCARRREREPPLKTGPAPTPMAEWLASWWNRPGAGRVYQASLTRDCFPSRGLGPSLPPIPWPRPRYYCVCPRVTSRLALNRAFATDVTLGFDRFPCCPPLARAPPLVFEHGAGASQAALLEAASAPCRSCGGAP